MALGMIEVEKVFNEIWSIWPNQSGESSARKAVKTYFNALGSKSELINACKAYVLEAASDDADFTYKLSNFINQDHWKDVLENTDIKRMGAKRDLAEKIISAWNNSCKDHWCKVNDVNYRLALVLKALDNKAFKEHWEEALRLAQGIFRYKFSDSDPRQKIILSLSWFTNVSPTKHVVLKIIDGEYGKYRKEAQKETKLQVKKINEEERALAVRQFAEIFGEKSPVKEKQIRKTKEQNGNTKEITEAVVESIRNTNCGTSKDDDRLEII